MLRIAVICFCLALSAVLDRPVCAEDYAWELTGAGRKLEIGEFVPWDSLNNTGVENEGTQLAAAYYFRSIEATQEPYALADFFDRSSRIRAAWRTEHATLEEQHYGIFSTGIVSTLDDTDGYSVDGRFVAPRMGWYLGAHIAAFDTDHSEHTTIFRQGVPTSQSTRRWSTDVERYELGGGKYFGKATSLDFTFGSSRLTLHDPEVICPLCVDVDADDWSIGILHVRGSSLRYSLFGGVFETEAPLASAGLAGFSDPTPRMNNILFPPVSYFRESLSAVERSLEFRAYSGGTELFPTHRLGVRLGYTRWQGDTQRDHAYDASTTWFFRRDFAVRVALSRTTQTVREFQNSLAKIDVAEVWLIGRL